MIFILVNTPTKEKGLGAGMASDLRYVEASARQISEYARGKTIVVEKSTLPIRTALTIQKILEVSNKKTINGEIKSLLFYQILNFYQKVQPWRILRIQIEY